MDVIALVVGVFLVAWFGNVLTRMARSVERIEEHLAALGGDNEDGRTGPALPD